MKKMFFKRYLIWSVTPISFLAILLLHFFSNRPVTLESLSAKINEQVSVEIKEAKRIEALYKEKKQIVTNDQDELIAFYYGDSIFYWSNTISLIKNISSYKDGISFQQLGIGDFILYKSTDSLSKLVFVNLIPLRKDYRIQNDLLLPQWIIPELKMTPVNFSPENKQGLKIINEYDKTTICFVTLNEKDSEFYKSFDNYTWIKFAFLLIFFLIMIYGLNDFFRTLSIRYSHRLGLEIYAIVLLIIYLFFTLSGIPSFLFKNEFFNPAIYASSGYFNSLGMVFLFTLFLCVIVFYSYFYVQELFNYSKAKVRYITCIMLLSFIFNGITFLGVFFIKSFNEDSQIPLSFYQVQNFNSYTLVVYIIITLLLISNFFIIKSVIKNWQSNKLPVWSFVLIQIAVLISCHVIGLVIYKSTLVIDWGIYPLTYCILSYFVYYHIGKKRILLFYFINMITMCTCAAFCFNYYAEKKENDNRKLIAKKLIKEQDQVTEYLYSQMKSNIQKEVSNLDYQENHKSSEEVVRIIRQKYFQGYFNKYLVQLYPVDSKQKISSYATIQLRELDSILTRLNSNLKSEDLHLIINENGSNYYGAKLSFHSKNNKNGSLFILLIPPSKNIQSAYPELLIEDQIKKLLINEVYNYAIYKNKELIRQSGNFPYNLKFDNTNYKNKEFTFNNESNYNHLIYNEQENNRIVIVSAFKKPYFTVISNACVLLILFGVCIFLLFAIFRFRQINSLVFEISISNKIFFATISIIFLLITTIGVLITIYYKNQFNEQIKDRLIKRINLIENQITNSYSNTNLMNSGNLNFISSIQQLSAINELDINLYQENGKLIASSQPAIFEKEILPAIINYDAYKEMRMNGKALYVQTEQIGKMRFLSAYIPISIKGEAHRYFLNVPFFSVTKELTTGMSIFLLLLADVYVLFILVALLLTYLLSSNITRPFSIIQQKMRAIKLGGKNEQIEWQEKDEIGILIKEYNRMITQLDESVKLLAKNERESAWREMSQQVAHEIKNPLTPMKLSIQFLQKSIRDNREDVLVLTQKVTETLIEQIENLAQIASQFSQFALISQASASKNDLLKIIDTSVLLYNQNENKVIINFQKPSIEIMVWVDKNQFVSVFNNLILNAIQAIPENKQGYIDIKVRQENKQVFIELSDNGIGMEEEVIKKIFEPNFTTKSSGTGLGLAIANTIIKNADGSIRVESDKGQKTTFYITLPVCE